MNASAVPPVAASQPGEQPARRPGAVEGEVVEAHHPAAQSVRRRELERGVGVRRPQREREARRRRGAAPTAASVDCGASASSARPNAAVPPSTSRGLAREIVAETSAPSSAPAPKHAVTTPKISGPSCSVCLASTGRRTLKLNENVVTSSTVAEHHAGERDAAHEREGLAAAAHERRALVARGRAGRAPPAGSAARLASTATKLTAFSRKHAPGPAAAITAPPSAGPDHAGAVEEARVERDRVRQLVAPDELERERLPRRMVDDQRDPAEPGEQVDHPRLDDRRRASPRRAPPRTPSRRPGSRSPSGARRAGRRARR